MALDLDVAAMFDDVPVVAPENRDPLAMINGNGQEVVASEDQPGEVIEAEFVVVAGSPPEALGTVAVTMAAPEDSSEGDWDVDDDDADDDWDDADTGDEIDELRNQVARAALRVAKLEAKLKTAKAESKNAIKALASAIAEKQMEPARKEEVVADPPSLAGTDLASTPAPEDDGAWRDAPLSNLSIRDSVLEKLYEQRIDTIGELEDLRAEIAIGKAKWPKGIGEAKITEIENAVMDWLGKNRDRAVLASAASEGAPA